MAAGQVLAHHIIEEILHIVPQQHDPVPSSTTQSPSSITSMTSPSTPAPSSHHFSIKAVEISNESSNIFLASETHLYQARLLQHAIGQPIVIATLATLAATPREKFIPPPASKFEICQDSTIKKAISTHLCLSEIDLSAIRRMAFSFKRALTSTPQFAAKKICPSPFPPSAPSTPQPTPTITPIPQLMSPLPDHRPSSTSSIDELKTPSPFSFGCPFPFELPTMTDPPFIPASMPSILSSSPVTALINPVLPLQSQKTTHPTSTPSSTATPSPVP